MTKDELKNMYFPVLLPEQREIADQLRLAAYRLAGSIMLNVPTSAAQTLAIRRIWEAINFAELALQEQVTHHD